MKRILIILCAALFVPCIVSAQVKKPSLMVVPSDVWCNTNGCMSEYDNQGVKQLVPDYRRALQSDPTLVAAVARINMLMADRGFPLRNLESVMKNIERNRAEDNLLTSRTSGATIAENPIDVLRRTARADIILSLTWSVNTTGPKKSVTYTLQGLDAYTDVQIAGAQGTGTNSFSTEIPVLIEEAVSVHMDEFADRLQKYFEDLENNGREVNIDIRVFDNGSGIDLETEFGGYELAEIIDDWFADNTVNHMFNKADATETYANYEQVRIPLYRTNGMGMDAEYFLRDLRRYLSSEHNIPSKLVARGLGRALLIIGEK
ncbi:MAG: hypothetical protein J1D86_05550 [Alistipes sp.]|nr:hypothetical protein [Alistipes sp.]